MTNLILPPSYRERRDDRPLTPDYCPGASIVDLFRRRSEAMTESRHRILVCREMRRNLLTVGVPEEWNDDADVRSVIEVISPERQSITMNLTNALGAREPVWTRKAYRSGSDTAMKAAEESEVALNAIRQQQVDFEEFVGKSVEDGEFGVVVMPRPSLIEKRPQYMIRDGKVSMPDSRYDRDSAGRSRSESGYTERSSRASIAAWRDDYRAMAAAELPVAVEIIPALDCVPILTRGYGRQRFQVRGLVVRQLMEPEELMAEGWAWDGMGNSAAIPRGFVNGRTSGQSGSFYLYRLFLTHIEPSGQAVPFVAYTVGGARTWNTSWSDDEDAHVINLRDEYGLNHLPVGYFYGLHHFDDEPDYRGMPLLWPLVRHILNKEQLLTAYLAHVHDNAFTGYVGVPDKDVPPESYLEMKDGRTTFAKFQLPRGKEIKMLPGAIVPWAQAQVGRGADMLMAEFTRTIMANEDDTTQQDKESGHAMVVGDQLMKTAKRQCIEGPRQASEFCGEQIAEQLCGLTRGQWKDAGGEGVEVWIAADIERTLDTGEKRSIGDLIQWKERWFGSNYQITAKLPKESNLAEIALKKDLALAGFALTEEVREAIGDENPQDFRIKKAAEDWYKTPVGQLTLDIEVAKLRRMDEETQRLEAMLANELNSLGFPKAALAPEFGAQPPGSAAQAPNPAENAKNGIISGEVGNASRQQDAMAAMTVNPRGL